MNDYMEERAMELANHIIETGATVRETAKVFGISKSTVHKDVCERLRRINKYALFWIKIRQNGTCAAGRQRISNTGGLDKAVENLARYVYDMH